MGYKEEGRAVSEPFEAGEIRQFTVGKAHIEKMTIARIVDLKSEEGPYVNCRTEERGKSVHKRYKTR